MSTHADDTRQQYEAECAAGHLPVGTRIRCEEELRWERRNYLGHSPSLVVKENGVLGTIVGHDRFGNEYHYKVQIDGTDEVVPYPCTAQYAVL